MSMGINLPTTSTTLTIITHLQQGSEMADLCTGDGRQQADSITVNFFSANSPTDMFRQLPLDAQQACEGAEPGTTLDELQASRGGLFIAVQIITRCAMLLSRRPGAAPNLGREDSSAMYQCQYRE